MGLSGVDPKDRRVTLRLSQDDLRRLRRTARRDGISVGAVIRRLVREHL